jgi:hypothetical protein
VIRHLGIDSVFLHGFWGNMMIIDDQRSSICTYIDDHLLKKKNMTFEYFRFNCNPHSVWMCLTLTSTFPQSTRNQHAKFMNNHSWKTLLHLPCRFVHGAPWLLTSLPCTRDACRHTWHHTEMHRTDDNIDSRQLALFPSSWMWWSGWKK